jgi:hypothetical protein
MRASWRKTFDPSLDFVVRRRVTLGGRIMEPGEAVDKTVMNLRRLRQLYDQRVIIFAGDKPGAYIPPATAEDEPETEAVSDDYPERTAVLIPADWRDLHWQTMRGLAAQITDLTLSTKADAIAAIELELTRRGQLS